MLSARIDNRTKPYYDIDFIFIYRAALVGGIISHPDFGFLENPAAEALRPGLGPRLARKPEASTWISSSSLRASSRAAATLGAITGPS